MVTKIATVIVNSVERGITMSKYYIKCGSLELIYSAPNSKPVEAAQIALWETNQFDVLDEYFYIDERGYRDYITADKETKVITLEKVAKLAGWKMR